MSKAEAPKAAYKVPKSSKAKAIKRPNRYMFSKIEIVGKHDGTGKHGRPKRWPNYKNGMTLAEIEETEGTERWDVLHWEKLGLMKIHEPNDDEYKARRRAFYKAKGIEDPELAKSKKVEAQKKAA